MASESPRARLDAQQPTLDDFEQWHAGPVVVQTSGSNSKTVHAPDEDADEPKPACKLAANAGVDENRKWLPSRLTGGLAAFRRPCKCDECHDRLVALADELEVEFDA